jgi:predicted RNase H-like nuclease (RuvC/YqgF family)
MILQLEFKQRKILALQTELTDNNEHADSLEKHLDKMNEDIYSVQVNHTH